MISDSTLVGIIILLVGAHYAGMIFELRKLRRDLDSLRSEISHAAIAAANAAAAAANAASAMASRQK